MQKVVVERQKIDNAAHGPLGRIHTQRQLGQLSRSVLRYNKPAET